MLEKPIKMVGLVGMALSVSEVQRKLRVRL